MPTLKPDSTVEIDPVALRRLRLEAGLTQRGLAKLAGGDPMSRRPEPDSEGVERRAPRLHHITVCNLERGVWERTSVHTAHRIANGLSKGLKRRVKVAEFTRNPDQDAAAGEPVAMAS